MRNISIQNKLMRSLRALHFVNTKTRLLRKLSRAYENSFASQIPPCFRTSFQDL